MEKTHSQKNNVLRSLFPILQQFEVFKNRALVLHFLMTSDAWYIHLLVLIFKDHSYLTSNSKGDSIENESCYWNKNQGASSFNNLQMKMLFIDPTSYAVPNMCLKLLKDLSGFSWEIFKDGRAKKECIFCGDIEHDWDWPEWLCLYVDLFIPHLFTWVVWLRCCASLTPSFLRP